MSQDDISNDATPEALDNAMNDAMSQDDNVEVGGADGPSSSDASPEASGESASAEAKSSGPNASSSASAPAASSPSSGGKSGTSMSGDVVMEALSGMSKGQTLAKKKGAVGTGLAAKTGSAATFLGTSALTGGITISGFQVAAAMINAFTDRYRVRETGNAVKAKDWASAKGRTKTGSQINENGTTLKTKAKMNKGRPRSYGKKPKAEDVLQSRGLAPAAKKTKSTGASLKSGSTTSAVFANNRKKAVLARFQSIQDNGHQGVQKGAKLAPKAMGQQINPNGVTGIRNDAHDRLMATMTQYRPNQMKNMAPRPI